MNKAIICGNIGKDPEVKHFEGGGKLVKFPVATTESYKNKDGQKVENTEWHNIVCNRKGLVDVIEKYAHKGQKVLIEGRIKTRSWDDQGVKKYATEIHLDQFQMLSKVEQQPAQPQSNPGALPDGEESDLPF